MNRLKRSAAIFGLVLLGLLAFDALVDLFTMHRDVTRGIHADTDLIALHAQHRHGDTSLQD